MKIDHETTIVLEGEREREALRQALLIAAEISNDAIRAGSPGGILIRAGLDDCGAVNAFREIVNQMVDSV